MKYDSDEALANELTRIGRALSPRPAGLRAALHAPRGEPVRSPLSIVTISNYMSTYTKLGATLVAIVVVAGGVYALSGSTDQGQVALETQTTESADTAAMKMAASNEQVTAPPADDTFDGFEAAMEADLAAQQSALNAVDQEAAAEAASVSSVNNNPTYDENAI